jgi:hypothetical protein
VRVCVCVCVCVRERERERDGERVRVRMCVCGLVLMCCVGVLYTAGPTVSIVSRLFCRVSTLIDSTCAIPAGKQLLARRRTGVYLFLLFRLLASVLFLLFYRLL